MATILTPYLISSNDGRDVRPALATNEHVKVAAKGESMEDVLRRWRKDRPDAEQADITPTVIKAQTVHEGIAHLHRHWHHHAGRHDDAQAIRDNFREYADNHREDAQDGAEEDAGKPSHKGKKKEKADAD